MEDPDLQQTRIEDLSTSEGLKLVTNSGRPRLAKKFWISLLVSDSLFVNGETAMLSRPNLPVFEIPIGYHPTWQENLENSRTSLVATATM